MTTQTDGAVLDAEGQIYDEGSLKLLVNRDHIRHRPGNYIPDTGTRGLHHLVYEVLYNAIDEFLVGYGKHIHVTIHPDGSIAVNDEGRGIPVDEHPDHKMSTLEMAMTLTGMSGKFDNNAYRVSAGLHGIGAKAVTALSELTRAEVRRNGRTYIQEYDRGVATGPVKDMGPTDRTGTRMQFWPDKEIFGEAEFSFDLLEERLRELAFLNRGLAIVFRDERTNKEASFFSEGGVAEYVAWLNRDIDPKLIVHAPIYIDKEVEHVRSIGDEQITDKVRVEVAFQYTPEDEETVRCFANNQYNPNGGTHLSGFRAGLTRAIKNYGEKENLFKDPKPEAKDFRQGLTGVVNITLPSPKFESQTKLALSNPEIEGIVSGVVYENLSTYLEENPKISERIIAKVKQAAEMREAEAKARKAVRDRKTILSGGGLPGKLLDCSSHGDETELFLVEGDSAGGSAEGGRDRNYQAILPLRGKPLNVEKARFENLLRNEEITSIIAAVGTDIGNPDDISKLRYGKIVILTDADVDGQHIRTLLLTFFFRQMRKLVEEGKIYVARPPLFKVKHKKTIRFVQTAEEIIGELMERGLTGTVLALPGDPPRKIEGDRLKELLEMAKKLEGSLQVLERRGVALAAFVTQATAEGLPAWHVKLGTKEHWFRSAEAVEQFRQDESRRLGRELVVIDSDEGKDQSDSHIVKEEYHEVTRLNEQVKKLHKEFGFSFGDLVSAPRIAGREPPIRYTLEHGDSRYNLPHLRELFEKIRSLGEKGMEVTRFKGLGEMDAEDLWETTLNPEKRTLLQVTLVDVQKGMSYSRR